MARKKKKTVRSVSDSSSSSTQADESVVDETTTTKNDAKDVLSKPVSRDFGPLGELTTAVDPERVPQWTRVVNQKVGHVGGMALWAVMMLVAWPLLMMALWGMARAFSTVMVPTFGEDVASAFGNDLRALLGSQDRFMFSWVMPVLFLTMVLALLCYGIGKWIVGHGLRLSRRLAEGLFSGYGRSLAEDIRLRKWDKVGRTQRAAEVKAFKRARREEKKKILQDIASAQAKDSRL